MKKTVGLRIDEELLKKLEKEAETQNRSLSNLIETICLEHFKKERREK